MARVYPKEFEDTYAEVLHKPTGGAYSKPEREAAKLQAFHDWQDHREIPEDPIADPDDSPGEALEKIVQHSLKSMTPTDAVKHRSQLLKFAGDTVLMDRKAKIEKQAQASGLSIITELFRQVASGEVKQGPGWVDAVVLPTLSAKEQAEAAISAGEDLDGEQRAAM